MVEDNNKNSEVDNWNEIELTNNNNIISSSENVGNIYMFGENKDMVVNGSSVIEDCSTINTTTTPSPSIEEEELLDIENTDYTVLIPFATNEESKIFSLKRLKSFLGPALFISVGYMDPGNWTTDIEGGSRFGYQLMWVLLVSNIMALFLQTLVIKLALVTQCDLAQQCRKEFNKFTNTLLWLISELAIISTDLAEVIGTAIGLNILFGLPLIAGVAITSLDTLLFLAIQRWGIRKLEFLILFLLTMITMCFVIELFLSKPIASEVFSGFVPILNSESVTIATGIVGATVMPHNLFLHGSVVKSRKIGNDKNSIKEAFKYNVVDTVLALNCAFFVNISILMLAASVFWKSGEIVTELQDAYRLLGNLMNGKLAAILFGLGLFLAGQSSTITGTMAGQIVMEGFIKLRIKPWIRRFITRLLAIIPAVIVILAFGDKATYNLLIVSQVILSIGLPFAVVPLILFTSNSNIMGEFKNSISITIITSIIACFIIALNLATIFQLIQQFLNGSIISKSLTIVFLIPLSIALLILLIWLIISKTNLFSKFINFLKNINNNNSNNFDINSSDSTIQRI